MQKARLAVHRRSACSGVKALRNVSSEAARRLCRAGRPVPGTAAEAYLRARGITAPLDWPALRYHPSVYYRADDHAELELWPALLAAVTALDGTISGVQRTWLDRERPAKAAHQFMGMLNELSLCPEKEIIEETIRMFLRHYWRRRSKR
jgi:hypothetical protein